MGDHFLQTQEVLFTGHLRCLVQGWRTKPPEGQMDQIYRSLLEQRTAAVIVEEL